MSDIFGAGQAVSGVAQAAGSIASAGIQAAATTHAADVAAAASDKAQNLLQGRYDSTRTDLQPFQQVGHNASDTINNNIPAYGAIDNGYVNTANSFIAQQNQLTGQAATLGQGGAAGQAALEQTPGYQFALSQGLRAAQNSASARGLGVSGVALKGASTFATGLADQTYGNQFNRLMASAKGYGDQASNLLGVNSAAQGNLTNSYNRLLGISSLGENAGAQTGSTGASLGNASAASINAGGGAQAAGAIQTGNALAGGVNGLANAVSQNQAAAKFNGSYGDGQTGDSLAYTAQQNPTSAGAYGPGY